MKEARFIQNVYDNKQLIWLKDMNYLITYESEEYYYFGQPVHNGISKKHENELFTIIETEDKKENLRKNEAIEK